MYKYKRVCQDCMTASYNHTDVCIKGCGSCFMTIDDFVDHSGIRNENEELLSQLESLMHKIKSEIEDFDKYWSNTWDTESDVQVEIPSTMDMVRYKEIVELP